MPSVNAINDSDGLLYHWCGFGRVNMTSKKHIYPNNKIITLIDQSLLTDLICVILSTFDDSFTHWIQLYYIKSSASLQSRIKDARKNKTIDK